MVLHDHVVEQNVNYYLKEKQKKGPSVVEEKLINFNVVGFRQILLAVKHPEDKLQKGKTIKVHSVIGKRVNIR